MKFKSVIIIMLFLTCNLGFGQELNVDVVSQGKVAAMIASMTGMLIQNDKIKDDNNSAAKALREQLGINYGETKYDDHKNTGFVKDLVGAFALNLIIKGLIATQFNPKDVDNIAYFPKNKRDYFNSITDVDAKLIGVASIDKNYVKSSNRQRFYQLRREVVGEYAKDSQEGRDLLTLTSIFYAFKGVQNSFLSELDAHKNLDY